MIRDALALIEAAHNEDMEGARVILGNGNNRWPGGCANITPGERETARA